MQFLIYRGIDMTIIDYRWGGTAEDWARCAANNEKTAVAGYGETAAREGPR